jgi:hypothetical protein
MVVGFRQARACNRKIIPHAEPPRCHDCVLHRWQQYMKDYKRELLVGPLTSAIGNEHARYDINDGVADMFLLYKKFLLITFQQ